AHAPRLGPRARFGDQSREQRAKRRPLAALKQELHSIESALALHLRGRGAEHGDAAVPGGVAYALEECRDLRLLRRLRAPHREIRERRPTRLAPLVEREARECAVTFAQQAREQRVR